MNIDIVCVGKIKENFYRDAIAEYVKRLSAYAKVKITEVKDEKTPDGQSAILDERIKELEGERILKAIKPTAFVCVLAVEGKKLDSVQFANEIENWGISGKSDVTFVIGGSLGLSDSVKKRGNLLLSFSDMTFPHQLMRVILLEQIYRAYRIMNKEPYHK